MTSDIGRTRAIAADASMRRTAARIPGTTDVGSPLTRTMSGKFELPKPFWRYDQYISGAGSATGPTFRILATTPTIVPNVVSERWKREPTGFSPLKSRSTKAWLTTTATGALG